MTKPFVEPYPDEIEAIQHAHVALQRRFAYTTFKGGLPTDLFRQVADEEFGKAGFTVEVAWDQVYKDGEPTELYSPEVSIVGRTKPVDETDHERIQWGVVRGLVDGLSGYIRPDGSKHEDPKKRDII